VNISSALSSLLILIAAPVAFAYPYQVIIIRHGEKPADVTATQLAPQGCARALSLPAFFKTNPIVNPPTAPIVAIYSVQPDAADGSVRPQETIAPTAIALQLQIHTHSETDFAGTVNDIMTNPAYDGKTVVLSWEHDNIPPLATAFGLSIPPQAQKWPGHVFDEAWVIRFSGPKQVSDFQIIPENVLLTDNPKGGVDHWGKKSDKEKDGACYSDQPTVLDLCSNNNDLEALRKIALQPN
jgi:hypothetical protein